MISYCIAIYHHGQCTAEVSKVVSTATERVVLQAMTCIFLKPYFHGLSTSVRPGLRPVKNLQRSSGGTTSIRDIPG